MPRSARIVIPGVPHHVVQRGNRRQRTFFQPADYAAYLAIAAEEFAAAQVEVWAYCLMPNHVHLIATPSDESGLAAVMGATHQRYTRRLNERMGWTGFLWQGRFSSFPMDETYLRRCARYIGLNPVRAGLVGHARDWRWSSVATHLGGRPDALLTRAPLVERLGPDLPGFFDIDLDECDRTDLRSASVAGRPLGAADWLRTLEATTGRSLAVNPRGRPRKLGTRTNFPPA